MEEQEAYEKALVIMMNYGYKPASLDEAEFILQSHINMMSNEKRDGKPRGEVHWTMLMVILHKLIEQKDIWTARENAGNSVMWLPYVIK